MSLGGTAGPVDYSAHYTYIDAEFRDSFLVNSPNHPQRDLEEPDDGQAQNPIGVEILARSSGHEFDDFAGMLEHMKQTKTIPVTRHTGPQLRPERLRGNVDSETAAC